MKNFICLLLIIIISSCATVPKRETTTKTSEERKSYYLKKDRPEELEYYELYSDAEYNASLDEVWDATLQSLQWMKWKVFSENKKDGIIVLKEAYVYRRDNKLKRIYHWPPSEYLESSKIYDYLRNVNDLIDTTNLKKTSFAQENLTINVTYITERLINVSIDYMITPYFSNGKIGPINPSSYYIENLILEKIAENLNMS